MTIGEITSEYRAQNRLSQREFAAKCGISHSSLALLERGYNPQTGKPVIPKISQLKKIARGLGMSLHDLCLKADDMEILLPNAFEVYGPAVTDEYDEEIIGFLAYLTTEQKKFLIAQLKVLKEQNDV